MFLSMAFEMIEFFIILTVFVTIVLGAFLYKKYVVIPYKNNVIKKYLLEINPNIKYYYEDKNEDFKSLSKRYNFIKSATSFYVSDIIVDDEIKSFDLHATHTQSNGKTSTTITDFKGRFYDVSIDQKYLCNFILKEEYWNKAPEGFTPLDLELTIFNKKFNLYVTDTLEAYHYFTPYTIKRLVELEEANDGELIFAYIDGHLYFGLNNGADFFEKSKTKEEVKAEYITQRNGVLKFKELIEKNS